MPPEDSFHFRFRAKANQLVDGWHVTTSMDFEDGSPVMTRTDGPFATRELAIGFAQGLHRFLVTEAEDQISKEGAVPGKPALIVDMKRGGTA